MASTPTRRRFRADPRLVLYTAGVLVAAPVRLWKKGKKLRRPGHESEADRRRWTCRVYTGRAGERGPPPRDGIAGPRVAFVGTGFGEMRLIERLSDALRAVRPDVKTTWCFKTREPAEAAAASRPDQPLVAMPFDFAVPVHNWLRNVKPDVLVFLEKFHYATFARGAAAAGVAVCVANGLSWPKSARSPLRRHPQRLFRRWLAGSFSYMGFQSAEQLERARPFLPTASRACVAGNMKFDVEPPRGTGAVARWLSSRGAVPLLAAGSTWIGDEDFVLRAFLAVRRSTPCALLLAPRQIDRAADLVALAAARGLRASRKSLEKPGSDARPADVYVLDTIGELLAAYGEAAAAFVGGTLAHRGHNVLEPLAWGLPVSYGPVRGSWAVEQVEFEAAGVGFRVSTPDELAAHWVTVLKDPALRDDVRARAAALLERQRGATARTVEAILSLLDGASPPP